MTSRPTTRTTNRHSLGALPAVPIVQSSALAIHVGALVGVAPGRVTPMSEKQLLPPGDRRPVTVSPDPEAGGGVHP